MDPGRFTLKELLWMVEAKTRYDWGHTSAKMAVQWNCHRVRGGWIPLDAFVPKTSEESGVSRNSSEVIQDEATKKEVGKKLQFLFNKERKNL